MYCMVESDEEAAPRFDQLCCPYSVSVHGRLGIGRPTLPSSEEFCQWKRTKHVRRGSSELHVI